MNRIGSRPTFSSRRRRCRFHHSSSVDILVKDLTPVRTSEVLRTNLINERHTHSTQNKNPQNEPCFSLDVLISIWKRLISLAFFFFSLFKTCQKKRSSDEAQIIQCLAFKDAIKAKCQSGNSFNSSCQPL